jgi:hypothetical protein
VDGEVRSQQHHRRCAPGSVSAAAVAFAVGIRIGAVKRVKEEALTVTVEAAGEGG